VDRNKRLQGLADETFEDLLREASAAGDVT
jgi:hypothetical protein